MHERLKTPKAKQLRKQRSSTVELVLGTLINFTAMRRVWTRGIANANKFMIGAAIAYNHKKYLKFSVKKIHAKVMELDKKIKSSQTNLSKSISSILSVDLKFISEVK